MNWLAAGIAVLVLGAAGPSALAAEKKSIIDQASDAIGDAVEDAAKAAQSAGKALSAPAGKTARKQKKKTEPVAETMDEAVKPDDGIKQTAPRKAVKAPAATAEPAPQAADDKATKAKAVVVKPDGKKAPQTSAPTAAPATKDAKGAPIPATADGKAAPKPPAELTEWPAVDIELAKARCTQLLKGVDAVTVPEPPMRKGGCGAPAPVRLIAIGKNPEVSLSPPAVLTCDMVVALDQWMKTAVQPAARKHLGADIVRIDTMSDYSCRMAYGRVGNKLSEHGKANALDIRGFVTSKAKTAYVLEEWGQTKRDIAKQIAAAKAAQEQADKLRLEAERKAQDNLRDPKAVASDSKAPPAALGSTTGTPAGGVAKTTIVDGVPKLTITLPGGTLPGGDGRKAADDDTGFGFAPRHLGGPRGEERVQVAEKKSGEKKPGKTKEKVAKPDDGDAKPGASAAADAVPDIVPSAPKTKTALFLHEVHAAACRIFGTTLGPEANEAHRNHLHVDMAERKFKKICD